MRHLSTLAALLLLFAFLFPATIFAADDKGIVVCGNVAGDECTFDDLIEQIQVVINYLIFRIAAPLAAVMFAYAGYLYVTNKGNESQITQAHEVFWNVFIGFVIALAAWLTINFILVFFLGADSPFNFLTGS